MPNKEERAYLLAHGICPQCGKNDIKQGETICWACKGYNRDYARIRRERNIKNGICVVCNVATAQPSKTLCKECAKKGVARRRARYHRLKEQGKCVLCGKYQATVGIYCVDCSIKVRVAKEFHKKTKVA